MIVIGNVIIVTGLVFILFGMFGYVKYRHFFERILITSKIDTVGVITILTGVAVRHGFGFFSLKILLLMGIIIIINPLATHIMTKCAYLSGLRPENPSAKVGD
jgi:multicomponent Na+:H+ antiporter subunit G